MLSKDFLESDFPIPRENSAEAITPYAVEQLYDNYSVQIKPADRRCLEETARKLIYDQFPKLDGQKILLNAHITTITLILIDLLRIAGASVSITATESLVIHTDALQAIKRAAKNASNKIEWIEKRSSKQTLTEILKARRYDFDITIDCGGGLIGLVVPKKRGVELTQTDPALYNGITYPVININDSQLKKIETLYGTGNAVCRLFQEVFPNLRGYNAEYTDLMLAAEVVKRSNEKLSIELQHKAKGSWFDKRHKFVIVGGGQVGMGIAHALQSAYTYDAAVSTYSTKKVTIGVDAKNITIIDTNKSALWLPKFIGYNTCLIDPKDLSKDGLIYQKIIEKLNEELIRTTKDKKIHFNNEQIVTTLKIHFERKRTANPADNLNADNLSLIHEVISFIQKTEVAFNIDLDNVETVILDIFTRMHTKYIQEIKNQFKEAYCVITATGVEGCMSRHFSPSDFPPNCILINMGTPDEWGNNFPLDRVLNDKKPANFLMTKPTEVHFLDPVFTALIYGCFCEVSPQETRGLISLPKQVENEIITMFRAHYSHINNFDALNRAVFQKHPGSPRKHIFKMDEDDFSSRDSSPTDDSLSDESSSGTLESSTPPTACLIPSSAPMDASSPPEVHVTFGSLQALSLKYSSSPEKILPKSPPTSPNKRKGSNIIEQKNLERVQNAEVYKSDSADTLFFKPYKFNKQVARKLNFDTNGSTSNTTHASSISRVPQKP